MVPQLEIKDADTGQTLLGTVIGGLISLMVFSFSMVMVVLNQASSNFSPRLLPGLISNKNHQYVLGIYLATIVYCILIFLSVESGEEKNKLPVLSVLIAIFLTICCLALFIYFIHSISQAIQVNHIVKNIYHTASNRLRFLKEQPSPGMPEFNTEDWFSHDAVQVGYYDGVHERSLKKLLKDKKGLHIYIPVCKGQFVQYGITLFKANREMPEEEVKEIMDCFQFTDGEIVRENYVLAFKQLTEIAIKAMSPAINDPGTAILCMDYITVLLKLRMLITDEPDVACYNNQYLIQAIVPFKDILHNMFIELRKYCAQDEIMNFKMTETLHYLERQDFAQVNYIEAIGEELALIKS